MPLRHLEIFLKSARRQLGNYGLLMVTLITLMLIRPFLNEDGEQGLLTDIVFWAIFLAGIYAVRMKSYSLWLAISLASIGFVLRLRFHFSADVGMELAFNLTYMLFFLHLLHNVGTHIWQQRYRVNHEVIFAAICVYLILGILWSFAYDILDIVQPHSFSGLTNDHQRKDDLYYFSYVTLATLGYGDIVPLTRPARSLAIVEAVTGQLYLAILISRLVGMHVAQLRPESHAARPTRPDPDQRP